MAKKKENQLNYLQMPLPEGMKHSKMTKRSWSGLNYRQTIDTGMLSMEMNISTAEAPYLVPSPMMLPMDVQQYGLADVKEYENPVGLFSFDDFLIVIYRKNTTMYIDYITGTKNESKSVYTGVLNDNVSLNDDRPRSVVQFNVYDTPADPIDGKYIKKLLFFPDCASMPMEIVDVGENYPPYLNDSEKRADVLYHYIKNGDKYGVFSFGENEDTGEFEETFTLSAIEGEEQSGCFALNGLSVVVRGYKPKDGVETPPDNADKDCYYKNLETQNVYRYYEYETEEGETESGWELFVPPSIPPIKYATVHLSRVFGVDDNRIYASGFNDYGNWNLDTVDEYNESNAWCSPSQSNTKADGAFTGITTFQNHVVCFKRDFMHEIYNTKNPFRVQDIYAEGAIDNRTIQDVDGRLVFVSEDEVKVYTGANPRILSYNLNLSHIEYAVSGTDGRNYYLYCETKKGKRFFVYDSYIEQWSERAIESPVINFAHNKNGMYALCEDGVIYQLDTNEYGEWSFETDLFTNETVDIKHIKKLQMFADIGVDSGIKVYFLYDNEVFNAEESHLVYDSNGAEGRKAIRVKPRQTAHYGFKVHVEGHGYVRLYEMEIEMQAGGGLYV